MQPSNDITGHDTTGHDTTGHDTTGHDTTGHDTTGHDTTRHDTSGHYVVGAIDVGGMSIKRGLVSIRDAVGRTGSAAVDLLAAHPIDATLSRRALLGEFEAAIDPVIASLSGAASARRRLDPPGLGTSRHVVRLGIAFPGPMDYAEGVPAIREQRKFDSIYGMNLRTWMSETWPECVLEVRFVNDAAAAALGELVAGAARGSTRSLTITLGTGFGAAAIVDGQSVDRLGAVEIPTLFELAVDGGGRADDELSAVGLASCVGVGVDELRVAADAARSGDDALRSRFATFGSHLGRFLAARLGDCALDVVVVGGGASNALDLFQAAVEREVAGFAGVAPVVRRAELGARAALIGAAVSL